MNIKKKLRSVLPASWIRSLSILRNPCLLHKTYGQRLAPFLRVSAGAHASDVDTLKARLRMYAHILEKGIRRRDFEPGHGSAIHSQAITCLARLACNDDESVRWARAIVAEYEVLQRGAPTHKFSPPHASPLTAEQSLAFLQSRSSCRDLSDAPVPEDAFLQMAEAAQQAATSCNRQTLRMFCASGNEAALGLLGCFKGFTGFGRGVQAGIVFAVDLRPYDFPRELFVPAVDSSLGVQNAVMQAHAIGLSVTLLSWGNSTPADEEKLRRLAGIPDYCLILVGAVVGFPLSNPEKPARMPARDILRIIRSGK
ncbi:MAG: nitroreductase family protein [Opitutales bacterium]|nr:nitroreductase family protein [Opitutales bacterium]